MESSLKSLHEDLAQLRLASQLLFAPLVTLAPPIQPGAGHLQKEKPRHLVAAGHYTEAARYAAVLTACSR